MNRLLIQVQNLKRPRILVQAAKVGAQHYQRKRYLRDHFGSAAPGTASNFVQELLAKENLHNQQRIEKSAHYRAGQHLEVMIALIAEAKLLADGQGLGLDECVRH